MSSRMSSIFRLSAMKASVTLSSALAVGLLAASGAARAELKCEPFKYGKTVLTDLEKCRSGIWSVLLNDGKIRSGSYELKAKSEAKGRSEEKGRSDEKAKSRSALESPSGGLRRIRTQYVFVRSRDGEEYTVQVEIPDASPEYLVLKAPPAMVEPCIHAGKPLRFGEGDQSMQLLGCD